jgi:hypothetical protein
MAILLQSVRTHFTYGAGALGNFADTAGTRR